MAEKGCGSPAARPQSWAWIGNAALSTPLLLYLSGLVALTIGGTGPGNLTLSGVISQLASPRALLIAGQTRSLNAQIITLASAYNATGGILLQSGNFVLGSGTITAGSAPLTVRGGSLRFTTNNSSFSNPVLLEGELLVVGSNSATFPSISSAIGKWGMARRMSPIAEGLNVLQTTLAQTASYTGAPRIEFDPSFPTPSNKAGKLLLTGTGALPDTSLHDVRSGSTLTVDGTAVGGTLDRIRNTAPVELHSGRLILRATGFFTKPQTETIGVLKIAGHSIVSMGISANTTVGGQIAAASLKRIGQGRCCCAAS